MELPKDYREKALHSKAHACRQSATRADFFGDEIKLTLDLPLSLRTVPTVRRTILPN
jgi:hypothetical protein